MKQMNILLFKNYVTHDIVGSIGGPNAKFTLKKSWNGTAECGLNKSSVNPERSKIKKF